MENFDLWAISIELFGGLGLFIYGMHVMAEGLQKSAGSRLKKFVELLTKNRIMAVGVGAIFTAIVQSSSATTVMVVGFVNAGIMNLTQAVGIIMGANIGTTITAQIVSLKLTAIAPVAVGAGVVMMLASSNSKHKKICADSYWIRCFIYGYGRYETCRKTTSELRRFHKFVTKFR